MTKIPAEIFWGCSSMTSFDLTGITEIGDYAFSETGLTGITIPDSVTTIKSCAFSGIHFGGSFSLQKIEVIGDSAFYNCGFTEVTIPATVTSIGDKAFGGHTVTKIVIDKDAYFCDVGLDPDVEFYSNVGDSTSLGRYSWTIGGYTFTLDDDDDKRMVKTFDLKLDVGAEIRNGGQFRSGSAITDPGDPEIAGKTFIFWADGSTAFDFNTGKMPCNDLTLHAVFQVTVTFTDEDRTAYYTESVDPGKAIALPGESNKVMKAGNVLVGWKIDGTGEIYGIGETYAVDSDTDIVAVWFKGTDVVVFISDGNEIDGDTYMPLVDGKAKLETGLTMPSENPFFAGWYYEDEDVYYAQGITLEASGTVRLEPYTIDCSSNYITIYYNYGESLRYEQCAEPGKKVMLPTSDDVEREGCRLAGWQLENGGTVTAPYKVPESEERYINLIAVWEAVSEVSFKDTDGTVLKELTVLTGETIMLYDGEGVPMQGTALVGWTTGSSETVYGLGTDFRIDSDIIFTAVKAETADALVYVTNGGTLKGNTYTPTEGGAAILDATVEKEGCMFLGWLMTDSEGNTVAYANGMSVGASGCIRLTAYLVPNDTTVYEVRYDFGDGTGSITSQKAEAGQLIALPTSRDVHREGYALTGWEVSAATAGMTAFLGAEPVALGAETITGPYYTVTSESVTISAIWESTAPAPEPVWWDDDDEPVVIPSGKTSSSSSERTDLTVAVAAAAAVAAIAALAIVDFRRK